MKDLSSGVSSDIDEESNSEAYMTPTMRIPGPVSEDAETATNGPEGRDVFSLGFPSASTYDAESAFSLPTRASASARPAESAYFRTNIGVADMSVDELGKFSDITSIPWTDSESSPAMSLVSYFMTSPTFMATGMAQTRITSHTANMAL